MAARRHELEQPQLRALRRRAADAYAALKGDAPAPA
jgi:hypothetical protein